MWRHRHRHSRGGYLDLGYGGVTALYFWALARNVEVLCNNKKVYLFS